MAVLMTTGPKKPARGDWDPVIGLEIHVELATASKMFCGCRNDPFDLPPNTAVCPTCLGLPGALPVINRDAVSLGIRAALALDCEVANTCAFERKSYAYPDLVKGYQLTQYERPVGRRGRVRVPPLDGEDGEGTEVAVRRVHLEEDTAKLIHDVDEVGRERTWLDANRSGVPLLEIVTEPTLHSPEEADRCLRELRNLLIYNRVAHCRMERGEMRLEANVSLRPAGSRGLGTRVEIKNQSSFRFLREAVEHEIRRQTRVLEQGGAVRRTTRGYNPDTRRTYVQRSKEEEQDYRYFPDPDLPPVAIDAAWRRAERQALPRSLDELRRNALAAGVRREQLETVLAEGEAGFLGRVAELYPQGVAGAAKLLVRDLFALSRERRVTVGESRLEPEALARVLRLADTGELTCRSVRKVLEVLFTEGGDPGEIVVRLGLARIRDRRLLEEAVDSVLAERTELVEQFRAGKMKVRRALFGAMMQKLEGRADPRELDRVLNQRLE